MITERARPTGRRRRRRAIALTIAAGIVVAACSADDADSDAAPVTASSSPAETVATSPEPTEVATTADSPDDTEPGESLESFYSDLSDSLAVGDLGFSIDRLDPVVFELFSRNRCTATLDRLADPTFRIEFHSEERREPWDFEVPDGRSVPIDDTVVTRIALFGPGQPGEPAESHVTIINGEYHWFTYC